MTALQAVRRLRSTLGLYEAALLEFEDILETEPEALNQRTPHARLERVLAEVRAHNAYENAIAKAIKAGR